MFVILIGMTFSHYGNNNKSNNRLKNNKKYGQCTLYFTSFVICPTPPLLSFSLALTAALFLAYALHVVLLLSQLDTHTHTHTNIQPNKS